MSPSPKQETPIEPADDKDDRKPLLNSTEQEPQPNHQTWKKTKELLTDIISYMTYDLAIWFFNIVIRTFFRDIKTRGTFNIPKKGAVVFVIAPHHNQFVDPFMVMSVVRAATSRQISLLVAAKSYRRLFIGFIARLCRTIPVERAQDLVETREGTIRIENFSADNDNLIVIGENTHFEKDAMPKGLVGLPEYLGNAQIEEVISDTKLKLRKPFKVNFENPSERDEKIMRYLTNGTLYKLAPHVDNHEVFSEVFNHLNRGRILGIFPEGGLHDRPTLLPLKPGVAIMALGAVANAKDPNAQVNVIPVGLNYFHPHRFRSRVVVEFGKAIRVTKEEGERYQQNSRKVVNKFLDLITLRLKEVTVVSDDYDTLMAIQAARRLYTSANREHIPLPLVVEMNRRLLNGYKKYANRPEVKDLKQSVSDYNQKLVAMGIHDHQVEHMVSSNRFSVLLRLISRLLQMILFMGLALPGAIMFSPVFITARRISQKKAKEALESSVVKIQAKDVLSTWKILVALGLAPMLYIFWALIAMFALRRLFPDFFQGIPSILLFVMMYLWMILTTYASLWTGEIGLDTYKSVKPLILSVLSHSKDVDQIEDLKQTRRELSHKVTQFCDRYGPLIFDDYDKFYRNYNLYSETSENLKDALPAREEEADREVNIPRNDSYSLNNLANIPIFSNVFESGNSQEESSEAHLSGAESDGNFSEKDAQQVDEKEDERFEAALLRLRKAMRGKASTWQDEE